MAYPLFQSTSRRCPGRALPFTIFPTPFSTTRPRLPHRPPKRWLRLVHATYRKAQIRRNLHRQPRPSRRDILQLPIAPLRRPRRPRHRHPLRLEPRQPLLKRAHRQRRLPRIPPHPQRPPRGLPGAPKRPSQPARDVRARQHRLQPQQLLRPRQQPRRAKPRR